jgi:hypothetical protein
VFQQSTGKVPISNDIFISYSSHFIIDNHHIAVCLMLCKFRTSQRAIGKKDKENSLVMIAGAGQNSYTKILSSSSSSSSSAQQPLVGPGLLKKLCPFVSVEGNFLCDVIPGRSVRF